MLRFFSMKKEEMDLYGPLAFLAGVWEGQKGHDVAPSDERGSETNLFKERIVFEPMGAINNHEQCLYGLRYKTTAWRLGEADAFHEELGYWLWDANDSQLLRCFMVPRGVAVLAGGVVAPGSKSFQLSAEVGSQTHGILSSKFLDVEFKVVRYDLKITIHDENSFTYEEDTQLKVKGKNEIFHHTDKNTVLRVMV